jgi:hypothetical protein
LPFYLRRLYAEAFADFGDAFEREIQLDDFALGVGGELFGVFAVGYHVDLTLRVGLARGVSEGGETQLYLNLGSPF